MADVIDYGAEEVLQDVEFVNNMKRFFKGVEKHGMPAVLKALNYLDYSKNDDEVRKIIDVVCTNVERATGRDISLLKKELKTMKKNEYTTARNLCVLFLDKYGDLSYAQISTFMSRKQKMYAYHIKRAFRAFHSDKPAEVKLVGSLTPKNFLETYHRIDKELEEHFKQNA